MLELASIPMNLPCRALATIARIAAPNLMVVRSS
jgi:hypothetical protein